MELEAYAISVLANLPSYRYYDTDDDAFFDDSDMDDEDMRCIQLYEKDPIEEEVSELSEVPMKQIEEKLIYDEIDEIIERELLEFESSFPYVTSEKFDPDRDLDELEYLINNPGASLLKKENIKEADEQNSKMLEFETESFSRELELTSKRLDFQPAIDCKQPAVEVTRFTLLGPTIISSSSGLEGKFSNFIDPFLLTIVDRNKILQDRIYDQLQGYQCFHRAYREYHFNKAEKINCLHIVIHKEDIEIFKQTKEWRIAWIKRNKALDVGNKALEFDDQDG